MQGLDVDLKNGSFSRAYLLYGSEEYLKTSYSKKLAAAICDPSDSMNYSYFDGKDINPLSIIDLAETLPFFGERRVIFIKNSGFFKSSCEELAEYLKSPCETTYFIFVEQEIDKRGKMYKAVSALGRVVEMVTPDENILLSWAAGILKRGGKQVRRSTLEYIFTKCGMDMTVLEKELNKLIDYTGDRDVVENSDVDAVCVTDIKNQVFDMVDAISEGNSRKALELYYDLLTLKVAPLSIMFQIGRQFNLIMQAKELSKTARDNKTLGTMMGLKPFVAGIYVNKARKYSMNYLKSALNECMELEEAAKTGRIDDRLSVELLIIKYSGERG